VRSKEFTNLFLALLLGIVSVFSFSHAGAIAYEKVFKVSDTFESGTVIGNVDVYGLTKEQAIEHITTSIHAWFQTSKLILNYKGIENAIASEMFIFSIKESVEVAKSGQISPLIFSVEEQAYLDMIRSFQDSFLEDAVNHSKLMKELEYVVMTMESGEFAFKLMDYIELEQETTIISSSESQLTKEQSLLLAEALGSETQLRIPAENSFSFLQFMNEHSLNLSTELASIIGSTLYKVILPSNFEVTERYISREMLNSIVLGYEVRISSPHADFTFFNPNAIDYSVKMKVQNELLQMELIGPPFLHQYEVVIQDKKIFMPKTIVQYDPKLSFNQTTIVDEGKEGYLVKVIRKRFDKNGGLLETEEISEDFYPPIHQIVLTSVQTNQMNEQEPETFYKDEESE
jgi:hypothetical protein